MNYELLTYQNSEYLQAEIKSVYISNMYQRIFRRSFQRYSFQPKLALRQTTARRFNSTNVEGKQKARGNEDSNKESFKKFYQNPLFKPLVILCFFGSQVLNVINIKKEHKEMEGNYKMKIDTLNQMIGIVSQTSGEISDDEKNRLGELRERLELINKRISNNELLKKGAYEELENNLDENKKKKSIGEIIDEDINDLIVSNFREEYEDGSEQNIETSKKDDVPKASSETIVIEDKLGAVEEVAKTRAVSKFL